jgi:anti-sigma factor ChrR (cupin superfamily)
MSSPPCPPTKPKPKPRQKTAWALESDTTVDEIEEVDDKVVALEWEWSKKGSRQRLA